MNRCLNCMKEYPVFSGREADLVCPHCGFVENTSPKIPYHLFPGTILKDRYIVGTVRGAGGFRITYIAWDSVDERPVVINEVFPVSVAQRVPGTKDVIICDVNKRKEYENILDSFIEDALGATRFYEEEFSWYTQDYFEENGTVYKVSEDLRRAVSLKNYLRCKPLGIDEALLLIKKIAKAASIAHSKKLVLLNFDPGIIFLIEGKIRIIPQFYNQNKESPDIILSCGYSAPESYMSKGYIGPETNIYSIGAILYMMMTGKVPVESVNRFDTGFFKKDKLIEPKQYVKELPEQINKAIMKAMALKPQQRFKTIEEFMEALTIG